MKIELLVELLQAAYTACFHFNPRSSLSRIAGFTIPPREFCSAPHSANNAICKPSLECVKKFLQLFFTREEESKVVQIRHY